MFFPCKNEVITKEEKKVRASKRTRAGSPPQQVMRPKYWYVGAGNQMGQVFTQLAQPKSLTKLKLKRFINKWINNISPNIHRSFKQLNQFHNDKSDE